MKATMKTTALRANGAHNGNQTQNQLIVLIPVNFNTKNTSHVMKPIVSSDKEKTLVTAPLPPLLLTFSLLLYKIWYNNI